MPQAVIGPERYSTWRATLLGRVTENLEQELLLDISGRLAGRHVLEIGSGDGSFAGAMAARGARVTGVDIDPAMAAAAAKSNPSASFLVADAENLPFPDGMFDVVVTSSVLCLVRDRHAALAEAARVLRAGGRAVIGELNRWSLWAARRRVKAMLGSSLWRRAHFSDVRSLSKELQNHGLEVEKVRGCIFYPPFGCAARFLAPVDATLGRCTTLNAAFLGIAARRSDGSARGKFLRQSSCPRSDDR